MMIIPNRWVFLYHYARAKCFATECGSFEENVFYKRVSGRTVQLDKTAKYSQSAQRKETLEVILEFVTVTDTKVST